MPGADADIVVVDPHREWTVWPKEMVTRAKGWSPYDGMELKGMPVSTLVMEELAADNRQLTGKPKGRFVLVAKP